MIFIIFKCLHVFETINYKQTKLKIPKNCKVVKITIRRILRDRLHISRVLSELINFYSPEIYSGEIEVH